MGKRALLQFLLLAAVQATALVWQSDGLPQSEFADTTVATSFPWRVSSITDERVGSVSMSFRASVSNAFEFAAGTVREDDPLSASDTEFRIGWSAGVWFFQFGRLAETLEIESSLAEGDDAVLLFSFRVGDNGQLKAVSATENGTPLAFAEDLPALPSAATWNRARVAASGFRTGREAIQAKWSADALWIMFK